MPGSNGFTSYADSAMPTALIFDFANVIGANTNSDKVSKIDFMVWFLKLLCAYKNRPLAKNFQIFLSVRQIKGFARPVVNESKGE